LTPEPVTGFQTQAGKGLLADVGASRVGLGNAALLEGLHIPLPLEAAAQAEALRAMGKSVMFLTTDGLLSGLIAAADRIKPQTAAALARLTAQGVRIVVATGDALATAQAVARLLGIGEVEAGLPPEGKAALVSRLRAEGRRVAMAGDGVNDAPALAVAEVGIAMPRVRRGGGKCGDHALVGRSDRHCTWHNAGPRHDAQYPAEPAVRLGLQRHLHPGGGGAFVLLHRAGPVAHNRRRRRDELVFGFGHHQRPAAARAAAVTDQAASSGSSTFARGAASVNTFNRSASPAWWRAGVRW
jgi:soluble P-type ATPase